MSSPIVPNVLVLLPAKARQVAYILYGLVALAVGSSLVGYAAAGYELPVWLVVTTAVVAYLAVPFSALAATNVSKTPPEKSAISLTDIPNGEHLLSPTERAKREQEWNA